VYRSCEIVRQGLAANNAAIVRAIIRLARTRTLAEGVEDESVVDHLRLLHCDEAQGYHFARPMPADEFLAYLIGK
jgi:EAL domain-containing protein (putative c-di-GMP-specific phosphodiesterase class I)